MILASDIATNIFYVCEKTMYATTFLSWLIIHYQPSSISMTIATGTVILVVLGIVLLNEYIIDMVRKCDCNL